MTKTDPNNYSVYKHTSPSGKVYIGITCQRVEARWQKDGRGYKNAGHFRNAILKYGWENIQHDVLATGLTQEQACSMEKELIRELRANDPAFGYNLSSGGENGWLGCHHTAEARRRLSESKMGEKNPMFGRHLSEEHRAKISQGNLGKTKSPETIRRMCEAQSHRSAETRRRLSEAQEKTPVICLDTGQVFPSVSEAARELGAPSSNICRCCKGTRKSAGGFRWAYAPIESAS